MRTKIVYCIISSDKDIYLEQAWVSIYTLKRYNPDAEVILLVDKDTEATLTGKRAGIRELVTEVIAVETPDGYNAMQRSRYLKTNFRKFITGDLLFIDSDTVIGGSLAGIDNVDAEIACVPDEHRRSSELLAIKTIKQRIRSVFGIQEIDSEFYFNSGVIYVKDTPRTHAFFVDWYEAWKYSAFERNLSFDQPALFVANRNNGCLIKELPGEYNCQIASSLKYLYSGLIIHFFNISIPTLSSEVSIFYGESFYKKLKDYGDISYDVKDVLDDKSRWFNLQANIIDKSHVDFFNTRIGCNIYKSYKEGTMLYKLNESFCVCKFMIHNYARQLNQKFRKHSN